MFCNAQSCVMNNGNATGYFGLERGTRQGNPLSPYLFILVLEILLIQIREDKKIKGFRFGTVEVKLIAYADDTTFLVRDVHSLKRVLKIMHKFEKYSSLTENVDKCESCGIGKSKKKESKPIKCRWTFLAKTLIKILKIYFSYDKKLAEKDNFYSLMLDCRSLLNIWKQRWLSLAGKIQIFKSLITSKPVYVSTMTTVSENFCDTLQSRQKEFIWGERKAKIKHSTSTGDYRLGGLKNVDIPSKIFSLKFMWIKLSRTGKIFIHGN